jgi:hypothetical protein
VRTSSQQSRVSSFACEAVRPKDRIACQSCSSSQATAKQMASTTYRMRPPLSARDSLPFQHIPSLIFPAPGASR